MRSDPDKTSEFDTAGEADDQAQIRCLIRSFSIRTIVDDVGRRKFDAHPSNSCSVDGCDEPFRLIVASEIDVDGTASPWTTVLRSCHRHAARLVSDAETSARDQMRRLRDVWKAARPEDSVTLGIEHRDLEPVSLEEWNELRAEGAP